MALSFCSGLTTTTADLSASSGATPASPPSTKPTSPTTSDTTASPTAILELKNFHMPVRNSNALCVQRFLQALAVFEQRDGCAFAWIDGYVRHVAVL